jgi:hypothetical protein
MKITLMKSSKEYLYGYGSLLSRKVFITIEVIFRGVSILVQRRHYRKLALKMDSHRPTSENRFLTTAPKNAIYAARLSSRL